MANSSGGGVPTYNNIYQNVLTSIEEINKVVDAVINGPLSKRSTRSQVNAAADNIVYVKLFVSNMGKVISTINRQRFKGGVDDTAIVMAANAVDKTVKIINNIKTSNIKQSRDKVADAFNFIDIVLQGMRGMRMSMKVIPLVMKDLKNYRTFLNSMVRAAQWSDVQIRLTFGILITLSKFENKHFKTINAAFNIAWKVFELTTRWQYRRFYKLKKLVRWALGTAVFALASLPVIMIGFKALSKIIDSSDEVFKKLGDLIDEVNKKEKNFRLINHILMGFGTALIFSFLTLKEVHKLSQDGTIWGALTFIIVYTASVVYIINTLTSPIVRLKSKNMLLVVKSLGVALGVMVATMYLVSRISRNYDEIILGTGLFVVVALTSVWVMHRISSNRIRQAMPKAAISLSIIGVAFIEFAAAVLVMTRTVSDETYILKFGSFVLSVLISVETFERVAMVNRKKSLTAAVTMTIISASFIGFAFAIKLITSSAGFNRDSAASFVMFMGMLVSSVLLFDSIRKLMPTSKKALSTAAVIAIISSSYIAFATAVHILTMGIYKNRNDLLVGYSLFVLILSTSLGVIYLFGKKPVEKSAMRASATLLIAGAAFITFALTTKMISQIMGDWKSLVAAFLMFFSILSTSIVVLYVVNTLNRGNTLLKGALLLSIVGAAYLLFAFTIKTINSVDLSWKSFGMLMATIGSAVAICAGLGVPVVAGLVALGAATLAGVGLALRVFVGSLVAVNSIKDQVDINSVSKFVSPSDDPGSIRGFVNNFVNSTKGISKRDVRRAKRIYLNTTRSIMSIVKSLKGVQSLLQETPAEVIIGNANKVVDGVVGIVKRLAEDEDIKNYSTGSEKRSLRLVRRLIRSTARIIRSATRMITDASNMVITEYVNGRAIKRRINESDFKSAGANIVKIITSMLSALDMSNEETQKQIGAQGVQLINDLMNSDSRRQRKKAKKTVFNMLDVAERVIDVMNGFGANAAVLASGSYKDPDTGKIRKIDAVTAGNNLVELIKAFAKADEIQTPKIFQYSTNMEKTADGMVSVIKAVNDVDLKKLTKVNDLFTNINNLASGIKYDVAALAKAISKDLTDALEALSEVLASINGKVDIVVSESPRSRTGVDIDNNVGVAVPKVAGIDPAILESTLSKLNQSINRLDQSIGGVVEGVESGIKVNVKNVGDFLGFNK